MFVGCHFETWPYNKQLFSQHHNTIFGKEEQLKKKTPITPVRNVLLTVLEGRPFQKQLLEAVVPVGYRTSHYKRENKVNPLS